ncbi:uncharacterized protein SPPG_08905 [Spizellomyces punctatus DAOM BR117]|uniref:Uncharacterized protein n=1 Tax=Spizellomyces punctatus (strain DAOM BR117) TaxID=645134 RepID=A0A0L0HQE4_SPIPD|nr:uncharacterized protein SPPG_08905 [Spizellomyces punctatus DAOM BR117]KND03606.1 hypothetical protein SPPG_08905 [Spizellomyces punctatus DAOM BR117]|eukprot:XP_016611645.1 hypothetical protein SPPG_08905 [Spizellomyces punctatus DAOM BR117]
MDKREVSGAAIDSRLQAADIPARPGRLIKKWSLIDTAEAGDVSQVPSGPSSVHKSKDKGSDLEDSGRQDSDSDPDEWRDTIRRDAAHSKGLVHHKDDIEASIDSPRSSSSSASNVTVKPKIPGGAFFDRLPPLRELSALLFPDTDLPSLPKPLAPKPQEHRRTHRRRTSNQTDYWSEFQLSKSQYLPGTLESVIPDVHLPRVVYLIRAMCMLCIMLLISGYYAAVSTIPIKQVYDGQGSAAGELRALVHVFLMTTGMGYYGSLSLSTGTGLRATFTHFWRVHVPPLLFGAICSGVCWVTMVTGNWPLPLQSFIYMLLFPPTIAVFVYWSIPARDRDVSGVIKLFIKRAMVFCLLPTLFYLCSALFMWAMTVNLHHPVRQIVSLTAYRAVTILFSALCQFLGNAVTKRRNPEIGSLMKFIIMYVQEVFVRLATPSLGTIWVFAGSLVLEAVNMSLPLFATHTFANKRIQSLNDLCTRIVSTGSRDVRRLYARKTRSRFRSMGRLSRRKVDPAADSNTSCAEGKGSSGTVAPEKRLTVDSMSEAALVLDVVVPMDLSSTLTSNPVVCEAVKTYFFCFVAKIASFITFGTAYPAFVWGPNFEWYQVPGEIANSPTKTLIYLGIHTLPVILHCILSTVYLRRSCGLDMFEYGLGLLHYYIEFFTGVAFAGPAFPHTMLGWHWNVLSFFQQTVA